MPISQEPDVLKLSLADRPYETDDKKRPKRSSNKAKAHGDESRIGGTTDIMGASQARRPAGINMAIDPSVAAAAAHAQLASMRQPYPGTEVLLSFQDGIANETGLPIANTQLTKASSAFYEFFKADSRECKWFLFPI